MPERTTSPEQFEIPTSTEAVASYIETPRTAEINRAYSDAMQAARDSQPANPEDLDSRRNEAIGGATVAAAANEQTPEVYYDPTSPLDIEQVGVRVVALRQAKLTKNDTALAA